METILIVDDEPHILSIINHFLKETPYKVVTAMNGEEGLRKSIALKPSVIITDVQMPRLTGPEMCERLLNNFPDWNPFIVVMTSRTELEFREWANDHQNVIFQEKPVSPRDLLNLIDDFLSRSILAPS